jgi:spermidine synthase
MILALFFCSGATALVYEVVWSKFLSQMLGSTIYAQTVVLASFMGGLALGNRLFGRWADRMPQPVRAYGYLEIIIGIYALLFPALDGLANHIFVAVGTPIAEQTALLIVLKGVLSAALLLGPTILMGGTLPLLAAWLQKFSADPGRASARFYSVNSLGAVVGSALAGFWLVQSFGLVATLRITALVNVMVGITAIVLSRPAAAEQSPGTESSAATATPAASPETLRWAGAIVALTGAVSMGLELLASRSLVLIFGSSLQSFAVVLIAFILGIGLGSAWIASPRRRASSSERVIVLLLCIAAAWVTLLVFNIERWVDFYRIARTGLARTPAGYVYNELLTVGISLVVLGFPAAWIGAVLPLMIRAISHEGSPLGARIGTLLTWNTLGAVAGTLITGFVLMPQLGLRNAFGALALVLALAAVVVGCRNAWRLGIAVAAGVCLLAGSLFVFGNETWQNVISSGVFRRHETVFDAKYMSMRIQHTKLVFYEDAPDATVTVEQTDGIVGPANLTLCINAKADASVGTDMANQLLLGYLPMLVKPEAKDVFVLGLGSGMTAGAVLAYPVSRVVVAENCEPVVRASKLFSDWNHHALDDPRTELRHEDARTVLKLRPNLYDVIIAEPSNPWTVGIGSVFSSEFYKLAASRLKNGGIMAQWFHSYEMDDRIMGLVLRTFGSVFPIMEVWDCGRGDIVMLGSMQPWRTGSEVFRKGFELERVRTDLWVIDIQSPEALWARQLASQRTGFAIAGDGPIQSDRFPVLEYAAPKAFYIGTESRILDRFDERTRRQLLAPTEKNAALQSLPLVSAQVVFDSFLTVNGELLPCLFGNPAGLNVPCVFRTATPRPPAGASGTVLDEAEKSIVAGNLDRAGQLVALVLNQNPNDEFAGYLLRVIGRLRNPGQLALDGKAR